MHSEVTVIVSSCIYYITFIDKIKVVFVNIEIDTRTDTARRVPTGEAIPFIVIFPAACITSDQVGTRRAVSALSVVRAHHPISFPRRSNVTRGGANLVSFQFICFKKSAGVKTSGSQGKCLIFPVISLAAQCFATS